MMSDLNKAEILANFQGCTGIEDVAEAIMWLEDSGWDLLTAIRNALPQESQTLPSDILSPASPSPPLVTDNIREPVRNGLPVTICDDFMDESPTTSAGKSSKIITFDIRYLDQMIKIPIPENLTISGLKTKLFAETGIPPCAQQLRGWPVEPASDEVKLKSLRLSRNVNLDLLVNDNTAMDLDGDSSEMMYTLNVLDETKCKDYIIKSPGSRTIGQVKQDIASLTDILPRNQQWCGWPNNVTDNTLLSNAGLNLPVHELSVKISRRTVLIDLVDSDSSPEEYEDASETFTDEMFVDDLLPRRVVPLIPDDVDDETAGAIHFVEGFGRRFGDSHPDFFPGTLDDALKEACFRPAKERRLLAIYLHHDRSVLSNVFCTELLCFESVLQTLAAYFIIWGWDITSEINKDKFLMSVTRSLGPQVAETISTIQVDNLPALIIITRSRSNTELFNVINGNIGINELLTMLIHAVDVYSEIQKAEMKEEEERAKREMIKIEQDQAFQQSLLLDRAKEEAKKQKEQLANQERERIQKEKEAEEKKRQDERRAIQSELPEEPVEGCSDTTIKIRFRCPKGNLLERRFLAEHSLQILFNYLVVQGYRPDEYKVILSWPRRDLTTLNPQSTFQDLKLHTQETVILEER